MRNNRNIDNLIQNIFKKYTESDIIVEKERRESSLLARRNRMKNIFIEYPKCSTCKKAKKWLEENNIEYIDRNIVEETPTIEELTEWIKISKQDIKKWFNTSGLKYKELNLKEKLLTISDKEKIELLASDGMLIKRPLLISDKGIFIGFKEENWKRLV